MSRSLFVVFWLSLISAMPLRAACMPDAAIPDDLLAVEADGRIRLKSGLVVRLAHLNWPDRVEGAARQSLAQRLTEAMARHELHWRAAGPPDRWGVPPVHLFLKEPGSALSPFLVQSGLVHHGLVPLWPDFTVTPCWAELEREERGARLAGRGLWADESAAGHFGFPRSGFEDMAGRRVSMEVVIRSVRPWRALHFINTGERVVPGAAQPYAFSMTATLVSGFTRFGDAPVHWAGRKALVRFVVPVGGVRRARLLSRHHIVQSR